MTRQVALIAAVALAAAPMDACTAKKDPKGPGYRLSGPGPEIAGGTLMLVGGIALARSSGTGEDQFNAQQTVFAIGAGIAVIGAIVIGHGIYRLANPPPAAPPPPAPPP